MKRYISIIAADGQRVSKMLDFDTQAEADAHAATYGGFVFDNVGGVELEFVTVDWAGQTATALSPAEIAAIKDARQQERLDAAATLHVDKVLGDIQRRALNVLFANINGVRVNAGQQPITLSQYVNLLNGPTGDGPITREQFINYVKGKL